MINAVLHLISSMSKLTRYSVRRSFQYCLQVIFKKKAKFLQRI